MSWYDGVPAMLLSAGPPANYAAASASSAAAQTIVGGTSATNWYLPSVPSGFWQLGKPGTLIFGHATGVMTLNASTISTILTIGLNSSLATAGSGAAPASTVIYSSPALFMNTNTANNGWEVDFKILSRTIGPGTTTVSTSLLTAGIFSAGSVQTIGNTTAQPVTTIDASVTQWMWATVTFNVASTNNSMTCQEFLLYGLT